jgi:2-oxoglutarate dehydrogenase E2 component (dihydrolipoamide succinyltransferase)
MAAFFRGLLVFLFGAIVGAGGILFFTPSFNVIVSRSGSVPKPIEVAVAQAPAALPIVPVATKATPPPAPAPAPASTAVAAAPVAAAPAAPVALAATEPAIDFKSISEHLILWPTSVTVKTATTVPVMADGKKVQDLALDVGTILQVSKVLADGSLEARAKGAKFEIKSTLTDFSAELGKRVSELVAKGVKIDSPFASAAVTMSPVAAPAVTPAPTAPVAVAIIVPKGPLTLAQRVDVLFGNKPEEVIPAAPAAPAASTAPAAPAAVVPAAPVVEAVPAAPMADPKAAEKGKDLDRKMNQLFK